MDSANIEITAGKWSGSEAVKEAESRLEFEKILRYCQNNPAGLRSITTQKIPPKNTQDYQKLVSSVVEKSDYLIALKAKFWYSEDLNKSQI